MLLVNFRTNDVLEQMMLMLILEHTNDGKYLNTLYQ